LEWEKTKNELKTSFRPLVVIKW